jgi:hypothetical protein
MNPIAGRKNTITCVPNLEVMGNSEPIKIEKKLSQRLFDCSDSTKRAM